jgi:molybdenum cofactor cytidylyltransferase
MGASVAYGIEQLSDQATAVLIALVDQPAVPPAVVQSLLESHARGGARILVPEFHGRGGHPILVDLSLRRELLNLDQDRGLRGLMDRFGNETRRVPVLSPFIARDMDTWQDYLSLHRDALDFPSPF